MKLSGFFKLTDYSLTHNILLLRSSSIVDDSVENTDIFFSSTFYIETVSYFQDVEIRNGTQEECDYILKKCDPEFVEALSSEEVFVLTSNNTNYYIGARKMEILKNNLDPSETSIGVKRK
ncbi:hypothetical protein WBJ53_24070 [Spirosoma sp. SC4-14]|uniref:hypothetical protein n=1 Tax=Spirosoma sp. SC4-14 TaxID=3128900 RepID=UPI0030CD9CC3